MLAELKGASEAVLVAAAADSPFLRPRGPPTPPGAPPTPSDASSCDTAPVRAPPPPHHTEPLPPTSLNVTQTSLLSVPRPSQRDTTGAVLRVTFVSR
eukprot:1360029-Pyramimonas_sp.AAC.1